MAYILHGHLITIEAGIIILYSTTVYTYKYLDAVRTMLPDEYSTHKPQDIPSHLLTTVVTIIYLFESLQSGLENQKWGLKRFDGTNSHLPVGSHYYFCYFVRIKYMKLQLGCITRQGCSDTHRLIVLDVCTSTCTDSPVRCHVISLYGFCFY